MAMVRTFFAVALVLGLWFASPETRETVYKPFAIAQNATYDVYASCSEQPNPTFATCYRIAIDRLSQATSHIDFDPQAFKQKLFEKASQAFAATRSLTSSSFVDAKAYALALQARAINSTIFDGAKTSISAGLVNAKTYALATYAQVMNSAIIADVSAYAREGYSRVLKSSAFIAVRTFVLDMSAEILSRAKALSSMQQIPVVCSFFTMVVAVLAASCRRRCRKVDRSANVTHPLEVGTATGAAELPPAIHRRRSRSRCDSPGASVQNQENEAPHANCGMGPEALLSQVNTGTSDELRALPGLGAASVKKIMDYRSKHGEINDIDELVVKIGLSRPVVTKFVRVHGL